MDVALRPTIQSFLPLLHFHLHNPPRRPCPLEVRIGSTTASCRQYLLICTPPLGPPSTHPPQCPHLQPFHRRRLPTPTSSTSTRDAIPLGCPLLSTVTFRFKELRLCCCHSQPAVHICRTSGGQKVGKGLQYGRLQQSHFSSRLSLFSIPLIYTEGSWSWLSSTRLHCPLVLWFPRNNTLQSAGVYSINILVLLLIIWWSLATGSCSLSPATTLRVGVYGSRYSLCIEWMSELGSWCR